MKTIPSTKFISINPNFNELSEGQTDDLYCFSEENLKKEDGKILKSSLTEEQFKTLYNGDWNFHRLFVEVHIRPNLKDGNHFFMMAGLGQIAEAFTGKYIYSTQTNYYIEYPERWLNIIEQRLLLPLLHATYPNSLFHIKTHSVYIIQCTRNQCIGIVDNHLKDIQETISYEDFIKGNIITCAKPDDESGIFVNGKQHKAT